MFAGWLGFEIEVEESVWTQFPPRNPDDLALHEADAGQAAFSGHGFERLRFDVGPRQEIVDL